MPALLITAICVNCIAFFLYGYDKRCAIKRKWRVPERVLLIWAAFAPFGAFAGMQMFRHKTKKPKFILSVPLFCALHILGIFYLIAKL